MNTQTSSVQKPRNSVQTQPKKEDSSVSMNPRKAATKAKEVGEHVEIVKKRLKVLQGQQEYNRYKTLDQEKRINFHISIHERILKQKELLRKSLEKVSDLTEAKEKTELIRQQIRQRIKQARKNLIEDRTDRTHLVSDESEQHQVQIKENREKEIQQNRDRKMSIQFQEEKKRQCLSRHFHDRLKSIRINKSIDSGALTRKVQQSQQELSRLMVYQQELIKKNSQSLQASQVMRHKFNQVFTTITHNSSRMLPQLRVRTNNSKYTNSTETAVM